MNVLYPNVTVKLVDADGNAFVILGLVMRALRKAGVEEVEVKKFEAEATSGDYDNLLRTCLKWVDVK